MLHIITKILKMDKDGTLS